MKFENETEEFVRYTKIRHGSSVRRKKYIMFFFRTTLLDLLNNAKKYHLLMEYAHRRLSL